MWAGYEGNYAPKEYIMLHILLAITTITAYCGTPETHECTLEDVRESTYCSTDEGEQDEVCDDTDNDCEEGGACYNNPQRCTREQE